MRLTKILFQILIGTGLVLFLLWFLFGKENDTLLAIGLISHIVGFVVYLIHGIIECINRRQEDGLREP